MTLKSRIPIEPLDDERVSRLERAIVASLPPRPAPPSRVRALVPWAIATAAAAAALLAWRMTATPAAAPSSFPPVAVEAAPAGTRVDLGDLVVTTGAGASFTVSRPDGGVSIALASGHLQLEVAPRGDRPPLVVHAGDVDVIDVGTVFTVDRTARSGGDDDVDVAVTEGVVQVRRGGTIATVAAGQSWSRRDRMAEISPAAPSSGTGGGHPGAGDDGASIDVLHGRTAATPPVPDDAAGDAHVASGRSHPRSHAGHPGAKDDGSPLSDLRRAIAAQEVAPAVALPDDGADPLTAYSRMASEKGATGAHGLYGVARTQFLAGHEDAALRSLEQYLARGFPAGDENEAVLWLRLRLRCRASFDDACRAAAHTYRDRIGGDSERVQLAERVINQP